MFSVVIPLYNKELSISKTINSVLNQNYPYFEVIVINDGSTDNSVEVLKHYKDKRLRLIHQENQGVSAARNKGVEKATFEWIAFLDGDDIWKSNHLDEIIKMMEIYPNEAMYTTSFSYSDGREIFKHSRPSSIFKIENYFQEAKLEPLVWTSIAVVNKKIFMDLNGFNERFSRGEDLDLWARFAKQYDIIKSSKVTATYMIDAENRTSLSKDLQPTHVYHININSSSTQDERDYYRHVILSTLYNYVRNSYYKSAIQLFKKHQSISVNDVLVFFSQHIKHSLNNRKKNSG